MFNVTPFRSTLIVLLGFSIVSLLASALWPVTVFFSVPVVVIVVAVLMFRREESKPPEPVVEPIQPKAMKVPVFGEPEDTTDPYRIVDDTQASMIFNKLSDVIVDTAYQTMRAHSVFLYVVSHDDDALVLQAFRTQSRCFNTGNRVMLAEAASAQAAIHAAKPSWFHGDGHSFCYDQKPAITAQLLYPVVKRGTVLGLLGVDFLSDEMESGRVANLMKLYSDLVLHAIQTVDAVHTRNVLKRWLSSLGMFVRQHRTTSEREIAHHVMDAIQESVKLDGIQVWMWPSDRSDPVLCGSRGLEDDKEQWIVPIQAGDEEWGFFRCLFTQQDDIAPIDREALKFIASTACLLFERCREAVAPSSAPAGAFDRRRFESRLKKEIVRAQRFKTRFGLVVWTISIPRDYHGSDAEKLFLDKIDEIFRNSIRAVDEAGRINETQFAALLAECSPKQIDKWLTRCWSDVLDHLEDDKSRMRIEIEIGVADSTAVHTIDEAWTVAASQTRRPPTPEQIKLL